MAKRRKPGKVYPNDPCPCESGAKYKQCCMDGEVVPAMHPEPRVDVPTVPAVSRNYFDLKGKTAEEFVQALAEKTFLMDWCYMNPSREPGKELCDLLVIFDDTAIIFQIKDLKLKDDGTLNRKGLEKNLRQLSGALRFLTRQNQPLTLTNPCRGSEVFNAKAIKKYHLVSVLTGDDPPALSMFETQGDNSVHVFNRDGIELALRELDTIADFSKYLDARESIPTGQLMVMGGEEELLAWYLSKNRTFDDMRNTDVVLLDGTLWEVFSQSKEYKAKKKADDISYAWDEMISGAHASGHPEYERVARELARPNRFERRVLAESFFEAHVAAHKTDRPTFRRIMSLAGRTYCFVFLDESYPRELRMKMVSAICTVGRIMFDNADVLAVATESKFRKQCSYDFGFLSVPEVTPSYRAKAEELKTKLEIMKNPTAGRAHIEEYPAIESE
jgi:hypothetical protein